MQPGAQQTGPGAPPRRTPSKAEPSPTPETAPYWEGTAQGRLLLQRCADGHVYGFPPRPFCPVCSTDDVAWVEASGRATLYSYVVQHRPAPGWEAEVPYVTAVVQLEEGPRMMTNVVGVPPEPEHLPLDLPLVVEFTQRGAHALPVFRPAAS